METPTRRITTASADPDFGKYNDSLVANNLRVGIVISKYGSSYYGRMLDGAGEWLQLNSCHVIVEASNVSCYGEQRTWKSLNECGCQGIIIQSITCCLMVTEKLFRN